MSAIDWISEIIVKTLDNNEDKPQEFVNFRLAVSWRQQSFSIASSTDEGQHPSFEQVEIDTSDYNDLHNFIEKLIAELKKIAFLHLNIAMTLVDSDNSRKVFTCQSCDSLIERVMDVYNMRYNEILRRKVTQEDHHAEILFFIRHDTTESMIFTSGYHNIKASEDLYLDILQLNPEPENLHFLGVIEGDDRKKVRQCTKIALKAVKERLRKTLEGLKSVEYIDAMIFTEMQEVFFGEKENKKKRDSEVPKPEKVYRRIMPSRQAKRETVDLTIDEKEEEEDEEKDYETESVTSSDFWEVCGSQVDVNWEKSSEKDPFKYEPFQSFLKNLDMGEIDKEYHQEMVLKSGKTYNQETEENDKKMMEKRKKFECKRKSRLKKEEETQERLFNDNLAEFIDDSRKEKSKNTQWFEPSRNSKLPKPSFSSVFSHHEEPFKDPSESSRALALTSPQLGRGLDPNEMVTFGEPPNKRTRKSLLFGDDEIVEMEAKQAERQRTERQAKNLTRGSSVRQFKQPIPQSTQSILNYTIPKKLRSPDRTPSGSIIDKSPTSSIQSRRPINSRSSEPLNRGARCLQLVNANKEIVNIKQLDKNLQTLHNSNKPYSPREPAKNYVPTSVSDFIDGEKPPAPDVIEIDSDNDDENNNVKRTRTLQPLPTPQKNYQFFTSKNDRNGPNSKRGGSKR